MAEWLPSGFDANKPLPPTPPGGSSSSEDEDIVADEYVKKEPTTINQVKLHCFRNRKDISNILRQIVRGQDFLCDIELPLQQQQIETLQDVMYELRTSWQRFLARSRCLDPDDCMAAQGFLDSIEDLITGIRTSQRNHTKEHMQYVQHALLLLENNIQNQCRSNWAFVLMADMWWFDDYWGSMNMPMPNPEGNEEGFTNPTDPPYPHLDENVRYSYRTPAWRYYSEFFDNADDLKDANFTDETRPIYLTSGADNRNFAFTQGFGSLVTMEYVPEEERVSEPRCTLLQILSGCQVARQCIARVTEMIGDIIACQAAVEKMTLKDKKEVQRLKEYHRAIQDSWNEFYSAGNGWALDKIDRTRLNLYFVILNKRFESMWDSMTEKTVAALFKAIVQLSWEINNNYITNLAFLLTADQPWFDDFWGSQRMAIPRVTQTQVGSHNVYPRPTVEPWPLGRPVSLDPPYRVHDDRFHGRPDHRYNDYTDTDPLIYITPERNNKNTVYIEVDHGKVPVNPQPVTVAQDSGINTSNNPFFEVGTPSDNKSPPARETSPTTPATSAAPAGNTTADSGTGGSPGNLSVVVEGAPGTDVTAVPLVPVFGPESGARAKSTYVPTTANLNNPFLPPVTQPRSQREKQKETKQQKRIEEEEDTERAFLQKQQDLFNQEMDEKEKKEKEKNPEQKQSEIVKSKYAAAIEARAEEARKQCKKCSAPFHPRTGVLQQDENKCSICNIMYPKPDEYTDIAHQPFNRPLPPARTFMRSPNISASIRSAIKSELLPLKAPRPKGLHLQPRVPLPIKKKSILKEKIAEQLAVNEDLEKQLEQAEARLAAKTAQIAAESADNQELLKQVEQAERAAGIRQQTSARAAPTSPVRDDREETQADIDKLRQNILEVTRKTEAMRDSEGYTQDMVKEVLAKKDALTQKLAEIQNKNKRRQETAAQIQASNLSDRDKKMYEMALRVRDMIIKTHGVGHSLELADIIQVYTQKDYDIKEAISQLVEQCLSQEARQVHERFFNETGRHITDEQMEIALIECQFMETFLEKKGRFMTDDEVAKAYENINATKGLKAMVIEKSNGRGGHLTLREYMELSRVEGGLTNKIRELLADKNPPVQCQESSISVRDRQIHQLAMDVKNMIIKEMGTGQELDLGDIIAAFAKQKHIYDTINYIKLYVLKQRQNISEQVFDPNVQQRIQEHIRQNNTPGRTQETDIDSAQRFIQMDTRNISPPAGVTRPQILETNIDDVEPTPKRRLRKKKKAADDTVTRAEEVEGYKGNMTQEQLLKFIEGDDAEDDSQAVDKKKKKKKSKKKKGAAAEDTSETMTTVTETLTQASSARATSPVRRSSPKKTPLTDSSLSDVSASDSWATQTSSLAGVSEREFYKAAEVWHKVPDQKNTKVKVVSTEEVKDRQTRRGGKKSRVRFNKDVQKRVHANTAPEVPTQLDTPVSRYSQPPSLLQIKTRPPSQPPSRQTSQTHARQSSQPPSRQSSQPPSRQSSQTQIRTAIQDVQRQQQSEQQTPVSRKSRAPSRQISKTPQPPPKDTQTRIHSQTYVRTRPLVAPLSPPITRPKQADGATYQQHPITSTPIASRQRSPSQSSVSPDRPPSRSPSRDRSYQQHLMSLDAASTPPRQRSPSPSRAGLDRPPSRSPSRETFGRPPSRSASRERSVSPARPGATGPLPLGHLTSALQEDLSTAIIGRHGATSIVFQEAMERGADMELDMDNVRRALAEEGYSQEQIAALDPYNLICHLKGFVEKKPVTMEQIRRGTARGRRAIGQLLLQIDELLYLISAMGNIHRKQISWNTFHDKLITPYWEFLAEGNGNKVDSSVGKEMDMLFDILKSVMQEYHEHQEKHGVQEGEEYKDLEKVLKDLQRAIQNNCRTHWAFVLMGDQPWFMDWWGSVFIPIPVLGNVQPDTYPLPEGGPWPRGEAPQYRSPPYRIHDPLVDGDVPAEIPPGVECLYLTGVHNPNFHKVKDHEGRDMVVNFLIPKPAGDIAESESETDAAPLLYYNVIQLLDGTEDAPPGATGKLFPFKSQSKSEASRAYSIPVVSTGATHAQGTRVPTTLTEIRNLCPRSRRSVGLIRFTLEYIKRKVERLLELCAQTDIQDALYALQKYWKSFQEAGSGQHLHHSDRQRFDRHLERLSQLVQEHKTSRDWAREVEKCLCKMEHEVVISSRTSWSFVLMFDQKWFWDYWGSLLMPIPVQAQKQPRTYKLPAGGPWSEGWPASGRVESPPYRYYDLDIEGPLAPVTRLPNMGRVEFTEAPILLTSGEDNQNFDLIIQPANYNESQFKAVYNDEDEFVPDSKGRVITPPGRFEPPPVPTPGEVNLDQSTQSSSHFHLPPPLQQYADQGVPFKAQPILAGATMLHPPQLMPGPAPSQPVLRPAAPPLVGQQLAIPTTMYPMPLPMAAQPPGFSGPPPLGYSGPPPPGIAAPIIPQFGLSVVPDVTLRVGSIHHVPLSDLPAPVDGAQSDYWPVRVVSLPVDPAQPGAMVTFQCPINNNKFELSAVHVFNEFQKRLDAGNLRIHANLDIGVGDGFPLRTGVITVDGRHEHRRAIVVAIPDGPGYRAPDGMQTRLVVTYADEPDMLPFCIDAHEVFFSCKDPLESQML